MMMMSEKEREMEMETEEETTLDHFIHEHPLSLIQTDKGDNVCRGCWKFFTEEAAYGCKKCRNEKLLHVDCAEMAREIWHPLHPQHTLLQKKPSGWKICSFCETSINGIGYFCTSSDDKFQIHLRCASASGLKRVGDVQTGVMHPSHPHHQLFLVRRKHSFKCDACGEMETDRSYVCITCQYLIHERCAALPATADFRHLHHHPLSLAFYLPLQYVRFDYVCDVCRKYLQINRWVYHCELCGYVAHIKCATGTPTILIEDTNETDAQCLIQFPVSDIFEELIKPFVVKEAMMEIVEDHKYWAPNHHHHELIKTLVPSDHISDDDDDEDGSKLTICDGCTTPITSQKQKYMMSCSSRECKYFLHLACFFLPPELPSHPLHHDAEADHKLVLQLCPKLRFFRSCHICEFYTNGLVYSCTTCDFKADIICASLPNTIQHQAHPHPNHYLQSFIPKNEIRAIKVHPCRGCGEFSSLRMSYKCGSSSCEFMLCIKCALLPPTNKHKLDKHPLPLTYDANLNHPDRFCCDECELEMNPKRWMYHCRDCDTSFHPSCFPATSGKYRNIKFGHRYAIRAALHPHPLTFSIITTKLRCDVCRTRIYGSYDRYDERGFHCTCCNFFMCLQICRHRRRFSNMKALD